MVRYGHDFVSNFWLQECGFAILASDKNAEVAQLVEQLIRNEQVAGSNPVFGST